MDKRTPPSDIEAFAREFELVFNEGNSPYGLAALGDEVDRLKQAPEGARNDQLNKSAYSLGQLVAGGELQRSWIESKLEDMGLQIGLTPAEINATIQSGLNAGMKHPRSANIRADEVPPPLQNERGDLHQLHWPGWVLYTLEDTVGELPQVEYVVEGLIERPSVNILYAPPGTFKSFVMQDLAICVAAGIKWLPPASQTQSLKPFETHQCPVLWLDSDQGRRNTIRRFAALRRHHDLPADTPLFIYTMPTPPLNAIDEKSIDYFTQVALEHKAGLIIIDTLKAVSGNVEENSGDMAMVMFAFRQVAEATGAAIILLHHQRKGSGYNGRPGDSLRGHSSIEAAIDLGLRIERESNSDEFKITATKTRGRKVDPISVRFLPTAGEDGELESAGFYRLDPGITSRQALVDEAILEVLSENELNQKDLVDAIQQKVAGAGINLVRGRAAALVTSGAIQDFRGDRNEKLYKLRGVSDDDH